MQFTKRITPPASGDLHWIKTTKGGYNKCIAINKTTGYVLPNCTGYAWGRFLEENNITTCNLSTANAENWYTNTSDGYQRGSTPKLGAIICFEGVGTKAGHVGVVEEIYSNGTINTSNSAYGGSTFFMKKLTPSNYYFGPGYIFQGFIYPPNEFDPEPIEIKKKEKFKWVLYARKLRQKRMFDK